MNHRCTNPLATDFEHYGGANPPVLVCDRWKDFENFLADMGPRPKGTSIGRYMDMGNYEPINCKWMTDAEQKEEARKKREFLKQLKKQVAAD